MLRVYEALASHGITVPFTLTDKYPNLAAFCRFSELHPEEVLYIADSIDATTVPRSLKGLRTMFNAIHHFAPESAPRTPSARSTRESRF